MRDDNCVVWIYTRLGTRDCDFAHAIVGNATSAVGLHKVSGKTHKHATSTNCSSTEAIYTIKVQGIIGRLIVSLLTRYPRLRCDKIVSFYNSVILRLSKDICSVIGSSIGRLKLYSAPTPSSRLYPSN